MRWKLVKQNLREMAALVTALMLVVPGAAMAQSAAGAQAPVQIIGHRGAAGLAPENTLAAFKRACEIGVDAIELDVLVSADGELVVHHDFKLKPEIARTPDGAWIPSGSQPAVKDLTLAQLKTYDIGRLQPKTPYAARFPEQTPVDGERIPTFKETIDDFNGSAPRAVKAAGGRVWSPFYKNLTPESLAEARQLGLLVSVWTPDTADDLKKLIEMKVDVITTNRPDVLKKLVGDK